MPPLYRLLSLRYLLHRWDRAALVVASIALGVATLVSARILNQCVETAASQTTTPAAGAADLYVSNGELGVLRTVVEDLRTANIPGVKSVAPLVFERLTLPDLSNRPGVLIGAELSTQILAADNPLGVTVERLTPSWTALTRRLVVVSRPLYQDWSADGTDRPLVVRFGARAVECTPVAVIDFAKDSPLAQLGLNVVGMEIGQAARFVRAGPSPAASALIGGMTDSGWEAANPPRVNRLDIALEKNAPPETIDRVRTIVGDRATVATPAEQGAATQEIVGGVQVGFLLCSAGAMVVGLFLVYNALSVTVAERRHDIGILRSIGATRWQVVRLFVLAALVLGLLGAAVGVPLGVAMARYTLAEFGDELASIFLNPETDPGQLTVATAVLATVAGIAVSIFAAIIPAVQAASDEPADAVRRTPGGPGGGWKLAHRLTCAVLIGGGLAMIFARHQLPQRVGAFGGMLAALIGLLLAAPIIVAVLVRIAQPVFRRVLPIEARLAADNLTRSPGRTGLVIGALGAGVAVMIQTAGVGRSNEEPVLAWIDEIIQADLFAVANGLAEGVSSQAPMQASVPRALGGHPAVSSAVGVRYVRPEYNGTVVFLIAIDAGPFVAETQARGPAGVPGLDPLRGLPGADAVVVSDNFAARHQVRAGDTVTLPGPAGPVTLTVAGSMRDYSWSRGTLFIDRTTYARLFHDDLVDACHLFLKPGADTAAVRSAVADQGLVAFDRPTMRRFLSELIERVYKLAYLQQIIVGIVAALGVVTALLISVLQRKRELGLLLAVGATPGQVIRSVLAEAALMGGFGTLLGVLIGLPLEWYVLAVVLPDESGFYLPVVFPWKQAAGIAVGAVGIATLAGLLPALHAVRTRIVDAIAHE